MDNLPQFTNFVTIAQPHIVALNLELCWCLGHVQCAPKCGSQEHGRCSREMASTYGALTGCHPADPLIFCLNISIHCKVVEVACPVIHSEIEDKALSQTRGL